MISAALIFFVSSLTMPCKTLYYILTPSHIIWRKDRFDCLLREGFSLCVCLEWGWGGGGGGLGCVSARNSLQILQVTTIS